MRGSAACAAPATSCVRAAPVLPCTACTPRPTLPCRPPAVLQPELAAAAVCHVFGPSAVHPRMRQELLLRRGPTAAAVPVSWSREGRGGAVQGWVALSFGVAVGSLRLFGMLGVLSDATAQRPG